MNEQLDRLREIAVSDNGFVFDPISGATFSVNGTGLSILHALKKGLDRQGIRAQLEAEFDTAGGDLDRDLDEFTNLLRDHGLLPQTFRL